MRYCKKCVQPDTRPGIYFNKNSVCGACLYQEDVNRNIDWISRERELRDIVKWAKETTKAAYDCVIGISGGKDSTFQALYARDRLGLRVLLANSEPEGITAIGAYNIENLIQQGFDTIKLRPNPGVIKKLIKRDFYKFLNPVKVTEYSLWSSAYIIADKFDIPLIIQGENPGLTLGARNTGVGTDGDALKANNQNTLSEDWRSYVDEQISEKDMFVYHYDQEALRRKGIRGLWLQYYAKEWSMSHNAEFSKAHGLRVRESFNPEDIGTYGEFYQMDSDLVQLNQMLKHIKFGFGQCTDHACYDIRAGRITRKEAIELVRKYDGKCAQRFIKQFCDLIDISIEEFWRVADSFRGPMWKKDENGQWSLIDPIWEQEQLDCRI
ncbi:MAG: N-acetyl sugar amidotransferase [Candidatus Omnitrophica bacterium]|nr:N-acetyl sugar amidotransferase [Candidatus Omnitrophota bacterium]